jgi:ATP-dependent Clp protease adaptor protein ClpS
MPYSAPIMQQGDSFHPIDDTRADAVRRDDVVANDIRAMANKDGEDAGTGVGVATRTRTRTKKPSLYKVLMLNDDYTPMEFVVLCLQRFFRMSIEDATRVMLHVHQKGVGVCGVFSHEVAETKATQVVDFARQHQHPLQCTIEKA